MAFLGGAIAGSFLGLLAGGIFGSGNSTSYSATTNTYVDTLSQVMVTNLNSANQTARFVQNIVTKDVRFECGEFEVSNKADVNMQAIGTLDAQTTTKMVNQIMQWIRNDIENNTTVRTSFLGSLPPNTTVTDIYNNMSTVVRSTVSISNVNSIRQALLAQQQISIGGGDVVSGAACRINNTLSVRMVAEAVLKAVSNALLSNTLTNAVMSSLKNTYNGTATGIFGPLEALFSAIGWAVAAVIAIVAIMIIIKVFGGIFSKKSQEQSTQPNPLVLGLLASASGSEKEGTSK